MRRPCLDCRRPTSGGPRCPEHTRLHDAARTAVYSNPKWGRASRRAIRNARGICPGYGVPPHPSDDLTGDHLIPLERGGDPFDPRNVSVLCRGCNARKRDRG